MANRSAQPNVLVLGAGGVLGEAWMSALLAGLEEATGWDPLACETYLGTSAGSIVAAALAAGVSPRDRVGAIPDQPAPDRSSPTEDGGAMAWALDLGRTAGVMTAAPLAALGLRTTSFGGALVRRLALGRVPRGRRSLGGLGREVESAGARWDGRLLVAAVELETGRRVVFGSPGAPEASVGEAVEASCAIPGYFRPVRLDGRHYVDGGAWSLTNADAVPAGKDSRVLCLNPTGSMRATRAAPAGAIGPLSRSVAAVEALALKRRGATVTTISPDRSSATAMGGDLMDPRRRAEVSRAGVAQGRRLTIGAGLQTPRAALVIVVAVGLAAAALGEAAGHHVAEREDGDVEPDLVGAELVGVRPVTGDHRSRDEGAGQDCDVGEELARLERRLGLGAEAAGVVPGAVVAMVAVARSSCLLLPWGTPSLGTVGMAPSHARSVLQHRAALRDEV